MKALTQAFNAAVDAQATSATTAPPPLPPPPPGGPPPLGSILQLAKETGMSRKECRKALMANGNDYDAARWALLPEPDGEAGTSGVESPPAARAVPGVFEPAAKFAGGKPGWMFKAGHLGVGYYLDAPLPVPPATAALGAAAADGPAPLDGFPAANWLMRGLIHAGYPGASDDDAAASIRRAVLDAGTTTIVCLQSERELDSLPPYMGGSIKTLPPPLSWLHLPVVDGSTAADDELRGLIERCLALMAKGGVLLVHCLGGHGRSGVVCACLAGALLGLPASEALALVKRAHDMREDDWARQHPSPETSGQVAQVERLLAGGGAYCRPSSQIHGGLTNRLYRIATDVALKLYGRAAVMQCVWETGEDHFAQLL
jgi:hypothetical protein